MTTSGPIAAQSGAYSRVTRLLLAVGPAVATLVLGAITFATFSHEAQTNALVLRTRDVIEATQTTLSALQDSETSQRGYLITGAIPYLDAYQRAVYALDGHVQAVRRLTYDNAAQQQRLERIERLIGVRTTQLAEVIALHGTGGLTAARAVVATNRGTALTDSLRLLLSEMENAEHELLGAREQSELRWRRFAMFVLVVGTLASAVLALLVANRFQRDARRENEFTLAREKQHEQLAAAHAELETQAQMLQGQALALETKNEELRAVTKELEAHGEARDEALFRTAVSESRYRALVAATSEFVWRQGPGGRFDAASAAWWRALTGKVPGAANDAMRWLEAVHPDDRSRARTAWAHAYAERLPFDTEYRVLTREGVHRHLAVRGVPVGGASPETTEWVGTFNDVTAEREAQALLAAAGLERERLLAAERTARELAETARAQAERDRIHAREANKAKSDFLANMSHELRTPLNAIQGFVQLLEMELHGPVTASQRDALARVGRAQRHLLGLINDVLNFAKLDAGKVEYDIKPVDVREAIADVVSMIEPQLTAKNIACKSHGDDNGAAHAWADVDKLRQILLNLFSNAGKFTPDGGQVSVDIEVPATATDTLAVHVSDTGIGIPADKIEAIFEPFVQVRSDRSRAHDGVGLGLAISRELAQAMGGDLRAQSTLGAGSTFTVLLRRAVPAGRRV